MNLKLLQKYGYEPKSSNPLDAANWTVPEDGFTQMFAERNQRQFWRPEEIPIANDIPSFEEKLSKEERHTYMQVLAGLSLLDTQQGDVGMPLLSLYTEGHQRKALLNWQAMIENLVHVKSYSGIFITLINKTEISSLFDWVKANPQLQTKAGIITSIYNQIKDNTKESYYKSLVASTMLESYLFYSGFYYPLLNYGKGQMINSGDTINLIIRDEAIHGVYGGMLAQEVFASFNSAQQKELDIWTNTLVADLFENEQVYTKELYDTLGLTKDADNFVMFNANSALANLGKDPFFTHDPINPIVLNGLSTGTKSHDFFSQKSSSYINPNIEELKDSDFDISDLVRPAI